jgi:PadR family transcriptional regulator PadR
MNTQFKKGILEMCVLSLVARKDYYGYELIEAISKEVEISEGSIYPILRRLTQDGFFKTYLEESQEGPPRKYYQITAEGKKASLKLLNEWNLFKKQIENLLNLKGDKKNEQTAIFR